MTADELVARVRENVFVEDMAAVSDLAELANRANVPVPAVRRLLEAYYGDRHEPLDVAVAAVAAEKIEAWLAGDRP